MILVAAAIALFAAPAPKPDLTDYLTGKDKTAIQEDVRQVAKTECQAEVDGPQLALLLACARAAPRQPERAVGARRPGVS